MQVTSTHSVNMQPCVWLCAGSKDTARSVDPDAFALQKQAGSQGETDTQTDYISSVLPAL